ncbi:hypothetical protein PYW08_011287 [Mythimna loreyi]|uniref:Uncharacterized protein n=1 Tax=Mythimna loreyi TaxID=667449 RepID=A0ACC2Q2V6_9NEOP|nr:hypothetical protein PYW08_011287 [Mythimna loreyi]
MYKMQFLLMAMVVCVGRVHSWDIATSAGDNLLNFYTNDVLTSTISLPNRKISALTFNEVQNTMLYVDKQPYNDNICGYDLTSMENKCFTKDSDRTIYGLAYDPVTERVFFTDTKYKSINWISLKPGSNNNVNFLIKVSEGIPRDIVVDSCKGYIYWLATGVEAPTIERARLDGTEREVFETLPVTPSSASYNLEPNSLAIDQHKQRIYWMQSHNTTQDRLFTRLLNIKHKPFYIIWERKHKNPKVPSNTLTISKDSILHIHTDSNVPVYLYTKVKSNETSNTVEMNENRIIEAKPVYSVIKKPISIVANYKIKDQIQDCEALLPVKLAIERPLCVHGTTVDDRAACTCTPGYTGERCDVSVCLNYCVQGVCSFSDDEGRPECRCNAGYSGERCQFSVCENFCVQGNCSINDDGVPVCRCNAGYSGERCQFSVCENFCVQGNCSINDDGVPVCRCNAGYSGERCQFSVCENFCVQGNCSVNDDGVPVCRCNAGYSGERCQFSVCENFCVQGNCSINDDGVPVCRCNAGYSEEKCQLSVCDNFCMHGNCITNDEELPVCRCNAGYTGERCEVNTCLGYCLNSGECFLNEEDEPSCECAEGYEGTRCEANKNETLTILVSHLGKSSTYSFPVNCGNL